MIANTSQDSSGQSSQQATYWGHLINLGGHGVGGCGRHSQEAISGEEGLWHKKCIQSKIIYWMFITLTLYLDILISGGIKITFKCKVIHTNTNVK